MLSTFKKMIHGKEKKEEKKPILDLEEPIKESVKEDFTIPEPEEIRRLPTPEPTREPVKEFEPIEKKESIPRRPLEPPPMKPLHEEIREPTRPQIPSMEPRREPHEEILRRLDDIDKRLTRIEEILTGRRY